MRRRRLVAVVAGVLAWSALTQGVASDDVVYPPTRWTPYISSPYDTPVSQHYELAHVTPSVHKSYAPRHLAETYLQPWYGSETFYAQRHYLRYVDSELEGVDWFDAFGAAIGRGWLVYSWEQQQQQRNGSLIRKGTSVTGNTNAYRTFFQNLAIASDTRGGTSMRLMAGDRIYTTFTPLTFFKPGYDGLRLDISNELLEATVLLSRIGAPTGERNNVAQMYGTHVSFRPFERGSVGFTYVNAHTAQTQVDLTAAHPLHGVLTTSQHQPVSKLWVRLRDDSPEDGTGGARLYSHKLILQRQDGDAWSAGRLQLQPTITGGRQEEGALVADGLDEILLEYDLSRLRFSRLQNIDLRRAVLEVTVANDYRIAMASDLQTDGDRSDPQIVFFDVARAHDNIGDESNTKVLILDYGLPTANGLLGMDWNLVDWHGLSLQGEVVFNRRYLRYPGIDAESNYLRRVQSPAAYVQAFWERPHFDTFFETFSIHHFYSTSFYLPQSSGEVRYRAPVPDLYEFVEDDDDNDGIPEWQRPFQLSSLQVAWPGFDEQHDFLYDHNQNGNFLPDYEEPFLRFRSDRPEFLFGPDMNHNGTVDRFENDLLADLPYKLDHHGWNTWVRLHAGPDADLLIGRQHMFQLKTDHATDALYLLGTLDLGSSPIGPLRVYDYAAWIRDDIRDDLQLWEQPVGGLGRMSDVADPLAGVDTWRNTIYVDAEQRPADGLRLFHRAKWDWWWQRAAGAELRAREGRRQSGFVGLIDKAEWLVPGPWGTTLSPRWKGEWSHRRPFSLRDDAATHTEQSVILLCTLPLMAESVRANYFARYGRQLFDTELQVGLDLSQLWLLEGTRPDVDQDVTTGVLAVQLTNRVAYQGYQLVSRLGLQLTRRHFERDGERRSNLFFLNINAGLR